MTRVPRKPESLSAFGHKGQPPTAEELARTLAAPRYAEGTGLRLPVAALEELPAIFTLVALKMDAQR